MKRPPCLLLLLTAKTATIPVNLKATISDVPDVYTLKNGIALGANIIDTDDWLIPVGLATTYEGNMSLIISGMGNYETQIALIDALADDPIDLTGLSSKESPFMQTNKRMLFRSL
jgi:hypothetical protein